MEKHSTILRLSLIHIYAKQEELTAIDGIGEVLADAWIQFFRNEKNNRVTDRLLAELTLPPAPEEEMCIRDRLNSMKR